MIGIAAINGVAQFGQFQWFQTFKGKARQRQKFNLGGELPRFDLQPLRSLGWFDKLTLNQWIRG